MRIFDPDSNRLQIRKLRKRWNEPRQPREITFSCYKRFKFLNSDRTRTWFVESMDRARSKHNVQIWAYVLMPEHVHLMLWPQERPEQISAFLRTLKENVARKAIAYLREASPAWLKQISVREGTRLRHRFWQPGGGYDRNVSGAKALYSMIDYIHNNPVRRGLVNYAEDWEWSSARWHLGMRPVKIEMDQISFDSLPEV
jgi:putative transposase